MTTQINCQRHSWLLEEGQDGSQPCPECANDAETARVLAGPVPTGLSNGFVNERGVSLRDYFIAHAPAEPQPWFHGVMPTPPAERMKRPDDITKAEAEELVGWGDWLNAADMKQPRARAIAEDWERHKREYSAWRAEQEKQRYIQWPAAWADAMLEQRAKGGAA